MPIGSPSRLSSLMVRVVIDIEADAGDPNAVNMVLKTQRDEPAEVE